MQRLGGDGVGTFWGVKSCKTRKAEVTVPVILCEAEMAQVRASEIADSVMHQVANIKLDQSVSRRRTSPGKTGCLSQWLGKGPKVQEWVLNRLRAHADMQAACKHGGACESKEECIHQPRQRNLSGLTVHGTGFQQPGKRNPWIPESTGLSGSHSILNRENLRVGLNKRCL